jgi:hypothetical protein
LQRGSRNDVAKKLKRRHTKRSEDQRNVRPDHAVIIKFGTFGSTVGLYISALLDDFAIELVSRRRLPIVLKQKMELIGRVILLVLSFAHSPWQSSR